MNNKKFYTITNFIIYSLIVILIAIISYEILTLYKKYTTPNPPKNSMNVSPKYNDSIFDVLLND